MQQAERGIFDLRRGRAIYLQGNGNGAVVLPVETMTGTDAAGLRAMGTGGLRLLLTPRRAAALGLSVNDTGAVALELPAAITAGHILKLATGGDDLTAADGYASAATDIVDATAVELARTARLLPATLAAPVSAAPSSLLQARLDNHSVLRVPLEEARERVNNPQPRLIRVSEATVPLEEAPFSRFLLFREDSGLFEHVAVLIGDRTTWPEAIPVRLHSACLTGDLFGSLRCDCGEQLRTSVRRIAAAGGGILLYMAQEGRGIGLANKLRAYGLQSQGLDTLDADRLLGFEDDERRYESAVAMLHALDVRRVTLYTNNPHKVTALQQGGIIVAERHPLHGRVHHHNRHYLRTKANRAGHLLEDLLNESHGVEGND